MFFQMFASKVIPLSIQQDVIDQENMIPLSDNFVIAYDQTHLLTTHG